LIGGKVVQDQYEDPLKVALDSSKLFGKPCRILGVLRLRDDEQDRMPEELRLSVLESIGKKERQPFLAPPGLQAGWHMKRCTQVGLRILDEVLGGFLIHF
jgi:hypothetical protein